MRTKGFIVALLIASSGLTACGEFDTSVSGPKWVDLPSGGQVLCMLGSSGSVDCDWDHMKGVR